MLGVVLVCLLAGCSAVDPNAGGHVTPSAPPKLAPSATGGTPARTSTVDPADALPVPAPWKPSRFDIQPDVKLRAAQVVEALGTWTKGEQGEVAARTRVAELGLNPELATPGNPFLTGADSATATVDFAQFGGLQADSASVLVVAQQWRTSPDGRVLHSGSTFDVRLRSATPRWNVTAVYPAQPKPQTSNLGEQAQAALRNPRLSLPTTAIADIRSGTVSEVALSALNQLASAHTLAISVVESGHPLAVFGTDRPSDHPKGRAIDIWQIDGRPVVDPATYPLVEEVMRSAVALGAYQAGGPVQLTPTSTFFSDDTHHDHVHLGFAD